MASYFLCRLKYAPYNCTQQIKTMKSYIYIKSFKVEHADNGKDCSDKIKLTSYKKKQSHNAKHKPTERAARQIDASLDRERTYLKNKAKNAARYARRKK